MPLWVVIIKARVGHGDGDEYLFAHIRCDRFNRHHRIVNVEVGISAEEALSVRRLSQSVGSGSSETVGSGSSEKKKSKTSLPWRRKT